MTKEVLTNIFQKSLKEQGYPIEDIKSDIARAEGERRRNPIRIVRNWTGLSDSAIREGIFNQDRDVLLPKINKAILSSLKPWILTETEQDLPAITVKEVSRSTKLSPEKVVNVLSNYPLAFSVNGSSVTTVIQKPEFPSRRLTLSDCRDYGLSPSRVARMARYLSRNPGGGPVQKAGIQNRDVDNLIRRNAWKERKIVFEQVVRDQENVDYGVMPELDVPIKVKNKTVGEIIYAELEGEKIMRGFQWFKEVGFGKNWIYRNNEAAFAENLVRLSRGEPVDFLIWNCIGFKWFENPKGEMPSCEINNNLDAAITPYFSRRIQELSVVLSDIRNPEITILLPSNEAFDGRVWKYKQSYEEREEVINEALAGLTGNLKDIPLPPKAKLKIMRWDEYLKSRGAMKTPEEYSQEGEIRVRQSASFEKIIREAVKSGRGYFAQNGIKNIRDEVFLAREIMYYGVYAGEGVAFEEFQERGRGIVVINFEEMRVPQMAFLGSRGSLPVVTPIKPEEMMGYYRWETRQNQKRQ